MYKIWIWAAFAPVRLALPHARQLLPQLLLFPGKVSGCNDLPKLGHKSLLSRILQVIFLFSLGEVKTYYCLTCRQLVYTRHYSLTMFAGAIRSSPILLDQHKPLIHRHSYSKRQDLHSAYIMQRLTTHAELFCWHSQPVCSGTLPKFSVTSNP